MVRGLEIFRQHFKDFTENYIIIGGTACDIVIDTVGLTPRATKDIDNVRKEALASLEKGRKKAKLEKLFSSWDGSNVALTKSIKESMNDPGSYKHNETRYKEIDDNTLFIITSFRGKNAFGGVVLNSCSAKQDIETELITEMNCE
mgnify:CR=1 FL=1